MTPSHCQLNRSPYLWEVADADKLYAFTRSSVHLLAEVKYEFAWATATGVYMHRIQVEIRMR